MCRGEMWKISSDFVMDREPLRQEAAELAKKREMHKLIVCENHERKAIVVRRAFVRSCEQVPRRLLAVSPCLSLRQTIQLIKLTPRSVMNSHRRRFIERLWKRSVTPPVSAVSNHDANE